MADGSFHYFRSSGKPFFDADGNFLGYRGTGADVTAQRQADDALAAAREELRDSEIKYQSIAAHVPGAVYRTSGGPDSRELFLGEQIEGICGYSAKELMAGPVTCMTVIHPDDRALVNEATAAAIAARQPYVVDYRIIHRDGSIRWLQDKGRAVFGETASRSSSTAWSSMSPSASNSRRTWQQSRPLWRRAKAAFAPWSPTFPRRRLSLPRQCRWTDLYVSDYGEALTGYPASDFMTRASVATPASPIPTTAR